MLVASPESAKRIAENWHRVNAEVAEAAQRAGRSPSEILIVGVSKYVDVDLTAQLFDAGCTALGENRPQNLWGKADQFARDQRPASWHLIGHLQRNKIRRTLPHIGWLHSLDSLRLATALDVEATEAGLKLKVLLEVNVTQDTSKTGLPTSDLMQVAEQVVALPSLDLRGLMAMCSLESDAEVARREFAEVRELRDQLQTRFGPQVNLDQLSMGMSGDFREAIAEGSTMLRIGSSLFAGVM
ncbi:MAG: YggS family pyridoxal phosphate-dependent enzyme [Pirellulaceae bacterium]|nr:YggS family pyridoxal phosphate-dependent enzyme [Pirellulaceae bacterium]